jgi:hypothetical protein
MISANLNTLSMCLTHSDSVARTRLIVLLCWLISSRDFFAFFSLNGHASVASAAVSFLFFFDPCWPCVCEVSEGKSNSSAVIDLLQPSIGPSLPARLLSIFDPVLALRKDCKFLNERAESVHCIYECMSNGSMNLASFICPLKISTSG